MTKITLQDPATFRNPDSIISVITANNEVIETASDDFLSRSGVSPNQMTSALDMNSNRILNLSAPTQSTDPVRLGDISSLSLPLLVTPTSSTDHAVVVFNGTTGKSLQSSDAVFNSANTTLIDPATGGSHYVYRPILTQVVPSGFAVYGTEYTAPILSGAFTDKLQFVAGPTVAFGSVATPIPAGTKVNVVGFESNLTSNQAAADVDVSGGNGLLSFGSTIAVHGGAQSAGLASTITIDTQPARHYGGNVNVANNVANTGSEFQYGYYAGSTGTQATTTAFKAFGNWTNALDAGTLPIINVSSLALTSAGTISMPANGVIRFNSNIILAPTNTNYIGLFDLTGGSNSKLLLGNASDPKVQAAAANGFIVTNLSASTLYGIVDSTGLGLWSSSAQSRTSLIVGASAGANTITLPNATDTLVGKATADTLTNKTLSAPALSGTITGTPTWGSSQAITLSSATQTAVNQLAGTVGIGTPANGSVGLLIVGPGNTSGSFAFIARNSSSTDMLILRDDGAMTFGVANTDVNFTGGIRSAASNTTASGFRILSGTAPTSPTDGDMWYDGTNVKFRVGGATKTFTLT